MSAVDWTSVLNGVHAWFVAGSGLAVERVLFAGRKGQAVPDGSAAWISIRFNGGQKNGRDWTVYTDNPSPTPGAELIATTRGMRKITMTATCFPPSSEADATSAWAILNDVSAIVDTPGRRLALHAAGVSLLSFDQATPIDGVINSVRFEPRAIMPFSFLIDSAVLETETYIETVNVETQILASDGSVAKDFTFPVTPLT